MLLQLQFSDFSGYKNNLRGLFKLHISEPVSSESDSVGLGLGLGLSIKQEYQVILMQLVPRAYFGKYSSMVCSEHMLRGGRTPIVWVCQNSYRVDHLCDFQVLLGYDSWLIFLKQFGKLGSQDGEIWRYLPQLCLDIPQKPKFTRDFWNSMACLIHVYH